MDRRAFLGALCAAPVALVAPAFAQEKTKIANVSPVLSPRLRAALDHEAALCEAYESCPADPADMYRTMEIRFRDEMFAVVHRDLASGNITVTVSGKA